MQNAANNNMWNDGGAKGSDTSELKNHETLQRISASLFEAHQGANNFHEVKWGSAQLLASGTLPGLDLTDRK